MSHVRKRFTYANVMSSIAVFLLLGGGAAFAALGKNTVGRKQLKKNAVNSSKVKNRSLRAVDFKAGQLPSGPQGPAGPRGAAGAAGPAGATGPAGAAGSAKAWAVVAASGALVKQFNIDGASHIATGRYCIDVGGGLDTSNSAALATLNWSDPVVFLGDSILVTSEETFNGCPAGQFEVRTGNSVGTSLDKGFDFMIP